MAPTHDDGDARTDERVTERPSGEDSAAETTDTTGDAPTGSDGTTASDDAAAVEADADAIIAELDALASSTAVSDSPVARSRVRRTRALARRLRERAVARPSVGAFDRSDAAEALLGSTLLGIPMAVEGGTTEVGSFLAAHPAALVATLVGGVGLVAGVIYVADIRQVGVEDRVAGVVPRRLLGVVTVSGVTATALLTAWGRVSWAEPVTALAAVVVAFVPMSLGAALGDLLPEDDRPGE